MDQNEMAALFSKILEQLELSNKNMGILNQTLVNHSDSLGRNTTTMENLEKVNSALGSVLAPGLSANATGNIVKEALSLFGKHLLK